MNKEILITAFCAMLLALGACSYSGSGNNQKITQIESSNLDTLGKILDLSVYKPQLAKFKYIYIDNNAERVVLVPGPSDSRFEAYMRFDSITMRRLQSAYFNADYPSQELSPDQFNFDWLDESVRAQLANSDSSYHGHPDIFFYGSTRCKLWMLNDGVLLWKGI